MTISAYALPNSLVREKKMCDFSSRFSRLPLAINGKNHRLLVSVNKQVTSLILITIGLILTQAKVAPCQTIANPQESQSNTESSLIKPVRSVTQASGDIPSPQDEIVDATFPSLKPKTQKSTTKADQSDPLSNLTAPTITVITSLTIVLGLFGAFVWMSRKFGISRASQGKLPTEAFETLGSFQLDSRTQIQAIRFGERILLLSLSGGVTSTLCEVSDPEEVIKILALIKGESRNEFAIAMENFSQKPSKSR
jgi:flagellar biogenesis protein FliO